MQTDKKKHERDKRCDTRRRPKQPSRALPSSDDALVRSAEQFRSLAPLVQERQSARLQTHERTAQRAQFIHLTLALLALPHVAVE
jgi:hypothetical protein